METDDDGDLAELPAAEAYFDDSQDEIDVVNLSMSEMKLGKFLKVLLGYLVTVGLAQATAVHCCKRSRTINALFSIISCVS